MNSLVHVAFSLLLLIGGISARLQADNNPAGGQVNFSGLPAPNRQAVETSEYTVYLPAVMQPAPWVNSLDRAAVERLFAREYLAFEDVNSGWSGDQNDCRPGSTSAAFREAILRRINFFRSLSGVPAVTALKDDYNQKAQSAALMMSVNRSLDHTPPDSWLCYSVEGYEGASSSNLYLGVYGPSAISGYMNDPGGGNYFVGHRRWILYPQTRYMGSGDIPPQNGYPAANALWVFDQENLWGPRPQTRQAFVAWPPPGYVPRQVVYPRWSFSYPQGDFSSATVTVSRQGQAVGVSVSPVVNGFGENTLVWELDEPLPESEAVYTVTIGSVLIDAAAQDFTYQVMIIPTD